MDASSFTFSVSVPCDPKYITTVKMLAVLAARYATCQEADAQSFGGSVEQAVRDCCRQAPAGKTIDVVVRRDAGPLEILVDGRAVTVEP